MDYEIYDELVRRFPMKMKKFKLKKKKIVRKKRVTKVQRLESIIKAENLRVRNFQRRIVEAENAVIVRDKEISDLNARLITDVFRWKTNDGRHILPKQMDEGHLRNTISFLQRRLVYQFGTATWLYRSEYNVQALYEMLKEARRRGIQV